MNIIRQVGSHTVYKIQSGYIMEVSKEPGWMLCDCTTDYDDALVRYNKLISLKTDQKFRLVSETVSIDVLEENK